MNYFNELPLHSRHHVSGSVHLISGPHYTVLSLWEMISRVGGPVWVDGAYKLADGSWHSKEPPIQ